MTCNHLLAFDNALRVRCLGQFGNRSAVTDNAGLLQCEARRVDRPVLAAVQNLLPGAAPGPSIRHNDESNAVFAASAAASALVAVVTPLAW